jgi:hypothetical protein
MGADCLPTPCETVLMAHDHRDDWSNLYPDGPIPAAESTRSTRRATVAGDAAEDTCEPGRSRSEQVGAGNGNDVPINVPVTQISVRISKIGLCVMLRETGVPASDPT